MPAVSESVVQGSVDHLFRRHAGQMVAVLARIFGIERLDAIEDSVQDALLAALRKWPYTDFPDNPRAWLIEVAKNRMLDRLRHDKRNEFIEDSDFEAVDDNATALTVMFANELDDDQLRMIFACCNPAITPDSQVALTLKIVGGFSVAEIARAFLAKEESIAKFLTRAKRKLRESAVFGIPGPSETPLRLDAAMKVLYLMFNEGYGASEGDELIRRDLCFEAIRLSEFLSTHPLTASPKVHALCALFLFQSARFDSRSDPAGELIPLSDQDRGLWDKRLLSLGLQHFKFSAAGCELSDYHLEAEIAALHSLASSYEQTDWQRILECYDILRLRRTSSVVELNRIVALSKVQDTRSALNELECVASRFDLKNYNLFHAVKGQLHFELGDFGGASGAFSSALSLTRNEPVRRFLQKRLSEISHTG